MDIFWVLFWVFFFVWWVFGNDGIFKISGFKSVLLVFYVLFEVGVLFFWCGWIDVVNDGFFRFY